MALQLLRDQTSPLLHYRAKCFDACLIIQVRKYEKDSLGLQSKLKMNIPQMIRRSIPAFCKGRKTPMSIVQNKQAFISNHSIISF